MTAPNRASIAIVLALLGISTGPQRSRPSQNEISKELQRLYDEDHQDQDAWTGTDEEFGRRQDVRRDRVMEILALGMLGPVQDWSNAAWLLQHGNTPEDYCLGHVLSVRPANERLPLSGFAAAATLDRFLERSGRTEVFSTQTYTETPYPAEPFGAYAAMPNSIRRVFTLDPVPGAAPKAVKVKELAKLLKLAAKDAANAGADPEAVPEWLARARAIVLSDALESENDFFAAAQVLLHSRDADDLLMSHVCAVAASIQGHEDGLRLSAETLDAFLLACGRPQIFGTARGADGKPRPPCTLAPEVVLRGYGLAKKGSR